MEKSNYKVAYATGSRADYGIVRKYLSYLDKDSEIDFSVLVTGSHMDERFGKTIAIIESDGYKIDFKLDLKIDTQSNTGILNSISIAVKNFGYFFENHKYNLLIILGDRYEMIAVALAAAIQRIPVLHLHGGEVTYGNYDEFIRHCITKMSRFHFASTEEYKKRIIQMGEDPNNVFNMGALGAENCLNIDEDLVDVNIKRFSNKNYFVVAFHPETLTNIDLGAQVEIVVSVLKKLLNEYEVVLIGSNADTKSDVIVNRWLELAEHDRVYYFENIKSDGYLYLVKNAICLIGNSSSGIIEAPTLKTYSINIGSRQKGRIHGNSVIDVPCDFKSIMNAIDAVLKDKYSISNLNNPYFQANTAYRYYKKTKELLLLDISSPKEFYDFQLQ